MDLGIAGRKAIVCASSRGLGRACARALAEAGCEITVNGRDAAALAKTARELRGISGAAVYEVGGDLDDPATRAALLAACPEADILVNNNGGPPYKPFAAITREDILAGLESNMLTPIALISGAGAGHGGAQVRPDRQHHLGFGPCADRRPRRLVGRARRSDRVPGLGRALIRGRQRDDQLDPARCFRHRPAATGTRTRRGAARGLAVGRARRGAGENPRQALRRPGRVWRALRLSGGRLAGFITGQNILIDGGAFPGAF